MIYIISLLFVAGISLVIVRWWYNSPRQKGKQGEQRVRDILSHLPEDYHVLQDIILKTEKGTTQIDHVVISRYGIFTIETKNYRGEIYGNDNIHEVKFMVTTPVKNGHSLSLQM